MGKSDGEREGERERERDRERRIMWSVPCVPKKCAMPIKFI